MKMTDGNVVVECTPLTKSIWLRHGFVECEDEIEKAIELTYQELKALAKGQGINSYKMTKEELLEALK